MNELSQNGVSRLGGRIATALIILDVQFEPSRHSSLQGIENWGESQRDQWRVSSPEAAAFPTAEKYQRHLVSKNCIELLGEIGGLLNVRNAMWRHLDFANFYRGGFEFVDKRAFMRARRKVRFERTVLDC